jgi:glycosyltransferase involved in cell wall biosynthesis
MSSSIELSLQLNTWEEYPIPNDLLPPLIRNSDFPLISVVTPSYNQGLFIEETIKSVLSQDYPNIEYWIVDGGSQDETLSVLQKYSDNPRFNFISEPDNGQADAINKGWSRCHGEIVTWLCSDDVYSDASLFRDIEKSFRESSETSVVYGKSTFIDVKGRHLYTNPIQHVDSDKFLAGINPIYQPASFLRRKSVLEVGSLNCELNFMMDFEYWLRLSSYNYQFKSIDRVMAYYRVWESSKTITQSNEFYDEMLSVLTSYKSPYILQLIRKQEMRDKLRIFLKVKHRYEWRFLWIRKFLDKLRFRAIY